VGLFGFVGKLLGGVAKVGLGLAGKIAPLAIGGPLGGAVGTIAGSLLHAKSPMSSGPLKINVLGKFGVPITRGQNPTPTRLPGGGLMTRPVLRASPVMPGGGVATSQGIMAPGGGLPPASYGGRKASSGKRRKRRSSSSRRSSHARKGRKRSGGRKLKFGSAAYRKKYLGHR
jgi:hypothetical protein